MALWQCCAGKKVKSPIKKKTPKPPHLLSPEKTSDGHSNRKDAYDGQLDLTVLSAICAKFCSRATTYITELNAMSYSSEYLAVSIEKLCLP